MTPVTDRQMISGTDAQCTDCGAALTGPYCAMCGQAARLHDTIRGLVEEFAHGVAHFDGRLWRTLPLLFLNPGRLSREWLDGRRTRYVAPLAVFLFAVFLLFLTPMITGGHLIRLQVQPSDPASGDGANVDGFGRGMIALGERLAANPAYYGKVIETLAYKTAFLAAPISAAVLALLTIRPGGFTAYSHMVVALYGLGFLALATAMANLLPGILSVAAAILIAVAAPVHAYAHLKGAYGLGAWGALARTLFLIPLTAAGFLVLLALLLWLGLS